MNWSRFNYLFKSDSGEMLLYNSGSNSFIQLDEKAFDKISDIKTDPNQDYSHSPDLYFKLRFGGFLVDDGVDDDLIRILKMNRLAARYSEGELILTVALTLDCNFDCTYCYEKNRTATTMSDETTNSLIQFIAKHKRVKKLKVYWYGGEPLLEFEKLKKLSQQMQSLGLKYDSHLITNGYLLTAEVVGALDELNLSHIQITIDGTKETHDKRRRLIYRSGTCDGTYDCIIGNIDSLMCSDWNGRLNLRVNIDKKNCSEYIEVYRLFRQKYPKKFDKQINVYPGFIDNHETKDGDSNCFTSSDKGLFLIDLAERYDIDALKMYPKYETGGCTMTKKNAYVIGPDGELYKCWRNLGKENEVIGDVFSLDNWKMPIIARGMIDGSYLDDNGCVRCTLFPICNGGCPKIRLHNKQLCNKQPCNSQTNEEQSERDVCMCFKSHFDRFLSLQHKRKTQIS